MQGDAFYTALSVFQKNLLGSVNWAGEKPSTDIELNGTP